MSKECSGSFLDCVLELDDIGSVSGFAPCAGWPWDVTSISLSFPTCKE